MTNDELIKCGCWFTDTGMLVTDDINLQAFAKLVAEREREACVEIAESKRHAPHFVLTSMPSQNGTAVDIANLIRARGQA